MRIHLNILNILFQNKVGWQNRPINANNWSLNKFNRNPNVKKWYQKIFMNGLIKNIHQPEYWGRGWKHIRSQHGFSDTLFYRRRGQMVFTERSNVNKNIKFNKKLPIFLEELKEKLLTSFSDSLPYMI